MGSSRYVNRRSELYSSEYHPLLQSTVNVVYKHLSPPLLEILMHSHWLHIYQLVQVDCSLDTEIPFNESKVPLQEKDFHFRLGVWVHFVHNILLCVILAVSPYI